MGLESATYISQLNTANPTGSDAKSTADDHLRLIKAVLQSQFTSLGAAAVTVTAALLNKLGVTATFGDNSTDPASTAFVQSAIAGVNAAVGFTTLSIVTGTTATATAGQHLALTNVALTTVTLPASPVAGDLIWITPCNGLSTNVIARNGKNIMSLAEDMTINSANVTICLRYVNLTVGWRLV